MRRPITLVITALTIAAPLCAQSKESPNGRWTGYMVEAGRDRQEITVDIRYEGGAMSGRVTGPKLGSPGNIRKGSYDAGTGAIAFEVAVEGADLVVNFKGKVQRDSISGTGEAPGVTGEFHLVRISAVVPASPPPRVIQPPRTAADTMFAAVQRGFTEVTGWVMKSAELVPPDKYTYRPASSVRTFGQMVAHVIDGYAYYCGRGAGGNVQWSDATEKGATDKAALTAKLKQATDACAAAYSNAKMFPPLMENIAHTNLHYGNIVTYLRMLGLTPPSS